MSEYSPHTFISAQKISKRRTSYSSATSLSSLSVGTAEMLSSFFEILSYYVSVRESRESNIMTSMISLIIPSFLELISTSGLSISLWWILTVKEVFGTVLLVVVQHLPIHHEHLSIRLSLQNTGHSGDSVE